MKQSALAVLLALAACGSPPPRAPAAGQQARAGVDAATKAYSDCVDSRAGSVDVSGALPGDVVDAIVKVCKPARDALLAKVAAFHRSGHPHETVAYSQLVAQESVGDVDGPIAAAAVVKIVGRQQSARKTGQ